MARAGHEVVIVERETAVDDERPALDEIAYLRFASVYRELAPDTVVPVLKTAFEGIEDGIDGLIHISELSWNHVNHPSEVVKVGDVVDTVVLGVDAGKKRISLSMKQVKKQ